MGNKAHREGIHMDNPRKKGKEAPLTKGEIEEWIRNGPTKDLVDRVEEFGRHIKKEGLNTTQIRQVFTRLKAIEAKGFLEKKLDFLMLKPLLAYAASRHSKNGLILLKERITWAIDEVMAGDEEEIRFKHFCRLFEAILAYHKAAGGK